jgi:hypothetical protein
MAYWNLYWVASDGVEDCFIIARNSRSACRIECDMNGFDTGDVKAEKILRISPSIEESYLQRNNSKKNEPHPWPWYAYRDTLEELGAEFRVIDDVEEMLLEDVVYAWDSGIATRLRSIGKKALIELKNNPDFKRYEDDEEDSWQPSQIHLLTMLGMCIAKCQQIEHYIAHSFILGVSKKQKHKYKTIKNLIDGWKKKTLGDLLHSIDEAYEIEPLVRASFQLFLKMRNELVHGITMSEKYDIETSWGQDELVAFLTFFNIVSNVVRKAFRSSFYASVHFGSEYLDKDGKIPKDLLTANQVDEISFFAEFFSPKRGCI